MSFFGINLSSLTERSILFILALLVYGNTCWNEYALDDAIVITENEFVQRGLQGIPGILANEGFTGFFKEKKQLVEGGRYRPLSLVTFAAEIHFFGENPHLSHAINSLLFALLCLVLYSGIQVLIRAFVTEEHVPRIAFFAVLWFAVHPIHTEVVANIKGRDEILSVLFIFTAFNAGMNYVNSRYWWKLPLVALFFFLALLSKEHAMVLFPLFIGLFVIQKEKENRCPRFYLLGALGVVLLLYLGLRQSAIGGAQLHVSNELMNNPYLLAESGQKLPTIFYTLLIYLKLIIYPHPLTYDYYPFHIAYQSWSNAWPWLSVGLYTMLFAVVLFSWKRHRLISLGLLFFLVTLLPMTNILVNIGSFMNERFLFLPSVGIALVVGYGISCIGERLSGKIGLALFLILILGYSIKTVSRNTCWKDNYTLFTHDVHVSDGSAKANCTAGGAMYERAVQMHGGEVRDSLLIGSKAYLTKAVEIYPGYIDALLLLGNAYYEHAQDIESAGKHYRTILEKSPQHTLAFTNYKKALIRHQNPRAKTDGFHYLLRYYPDDFELNYHLGTTYGKMLGDLERSIHFLQTAIAIQPENATVLCDMGVAYAMSGRFSESLPHFTKADSLRPNVPENLINLGITYQKLGDLTKAKEYFLRAEKLK